MRTPIVQLAPRREVGQNPGLILARYLAEQSDDGRDKRLLLAAACAASRDPSLNAVYRRAYERWSQSVSGIKEEEDLQTPAHTRLIVGLGNKGVIEAGLRLHHTYGVPLIPGSALKGLASHYCHDVYGPADSLYRRGGGYHELLFGTTEDSGVIRFEDAWMHPDSLTGPRQGMFKDVMTPHHQKWQTDEEAAPTDFDSPVPVPFVSVAGRFHVVVSWQGPDDPQAGAWTKRAMEILKAALADWGAGGKTTSGYGRLTELGGSQTTSTPTPPPSTKRRVSGTPTKVEIIGPRSKGGFDVQEAGRPPGTLTLGKPGPDVRTDSKAIVDVVVHVDDPRNPQYKWPDPAKPTPSPKRK